MNIPAQLVAAAHALAKLTARPDVTFYQQDNRWIARLSPRYP